MRIFVPNYSAPDNFEENVAFTLRQLGHEVRTLPERSNGWLGSRLRRYGRAFAERALPASASLFERQLLREAKNFRPELVLSLTQALSEETLDELRRLGVAHRVAWWGDPPANMKQMGLLSDGWDLIFLKDPDAVAKFVRVGLPAALMHEAMNPAWHRPLSSQANDELVVAGSFYGYRQRLVRKLIQDGVPLGLYGGRLPRWIDPEIARRHTGRFIVKEEKSRIFGAGLACLNSTSLAEGNSLNCRAFEIAGAGGLQLLEDRPTLRACFEPGKELLAFSTYEELLAHLDRARRFPAEMVAIRAAGARRALADHTYAHRLSGMLEIIAAR